MKNLTLFVYPTNPRKIPHSPHALSQLLCARFSSMRAGAYLRTPTCSAIFTDSKGLFFPNTSIKLFSFSFSASSRYSFPFCLLLSALLLGFEVAYRFAALAPSNPRKAPCFIRIAGKLKDIASSAREEKGKEEGERGGDCHFRLKIACLPSVCISKTTSFANAFLSSNGGNSARDARDFVLSSR